jgi:undecaprenyl-diphosphatase
MLNKHHNNCSDIFASMCSNKFFWVPLYLFLLIKLFKIFNRKIYITIICAVILVFSTDQLSRVIKNSVQRLRPCHNTSINNVVHLYNNDCGGQFGFVSSHAANCAAIAVFVILLIGKKNNLIFFSLIFYTLLVSYSRIMLGRHYPLDIVGGWIIGLLCAAICYQLHRYMQKMS